MIRIRLIALVLFAPPLVMGCGDDCKKCQECNCDGATSCKGKTAADGGSDAGVDGGKSGTGIEGDLCATKSDCTSNLICAPWGMLSSTELISVCARSCKSDTDCEKDKSEKCVINSRQAADAFCLLEETTEYELCGAPITTQCADPMQCIIDISSLVGACLVSCETSSNGVNECKEGQDCVGEGNFEAGIGICGKTVARGETCNLFEGTDCLKEDICSPSRTNPNAPTTCRQRCSESDTACDVGVCRQVGSDPYIIWACY